VSRPVVVADSGPLIALAGCNCLQLLVIVFEKVHIPQAVHQETTGWHSRLGAQSIAQFIEEHALVHASRDDPIYMAAVRHLDEGEAQGISLAHSLGCGVLIDERRGRQTVKRQGLPLYGVLGTLLQAKRLGAISQIGSALQQMQINGYRVSTELVQEALKLAKEL
jgi:uncharacterized protein